MACQPVRQLSNPRFNRLSLVDRVYLPCLMHTIYTTQMRAMPVNTRTRAALQIHEKEGMQLSWAVWRAPRSTSRESHGVEVAGWAAWTNGTSLRPQIAMPPNQARRRPSARAPSAAPA